MENSNTYEFIYHQHGHSTSITSSFFNDRYIVTGDKRGIVQIWSAKDNHPIVTFYAHHAPISSVFVFLENLLVTGSKDAKIKIWSLETFELVTSVTAHISFLVKLISHDNFIYSIGSDDNLRKWSFDGAELVLSGNVKVQGISDFFILGDTILTTTADGLLSIYDLNTLKMRGYARLNAGKVGKAINHLFKEYKRKDNPALFFSQIARRYGIPVSDAVIMDNKAVCAHHFGLISVWDRKKWKHREAYFAHDTHITGMGKIVKESKELLVTVSLDKTIKIHDPYKKQVLYTHRFDFRPTNLSVDSASNSILVGFDNGAVIILDNNLEVLSDIPSIAESSSAAISPSGLIVGLKSGHIRMIDPIDFTSFKSHKLFDSEVKGITYKGNNIIAVSSSGRLKVLKMGDLEQVKEMTLDFRPDKVFRIRHYLTLKDSFAFDLNKMEVIKGTVSDDTRKRWFEQQPFDLNILSGDVIVNIYPHNFDIDLNISDEDTRGLITILKKMIDSKSSKPYKRKGVAIYNSKLLSGNGDK